jgi:hypothetical protein
MMTRRERLMATLQGKPVDRPAVNFYEVGGIKSDPGNTDPFNIYNSPSWKPLLQLAEEKTDLIWMRGPHVRVVAGVQRQEFFKTEQYMENGSRFTRQTVTVGKHKLTSLSRRDPGVDTIWTLEHLLKGPEDAEAYLQLPDEAFSHDIDVSNLIEEERAIGDRGIVMVDTADPICAAAQLFSMEDFTLVAFTEQKLFHRLLEQASRYLYPMTEKIARDFPGHLWRIYGPEYATEPYLPESLFGEYVDRYTEPIVKSIQRHGGFARVHCHGRIRKALPHFRKMGVDAIDPIEPPPQGDIQLEEVRREYGKGIALFGNLEACDLENLEPKEFEKRVERAIREGTSGSGRGFVLMPSSAPYGRTITARTMANYETMIRLVGA